MHTDIPGHEGRYAITEDGRVWSHPKKPRVGRPSHGAWLTPQTRFGYLTVSLRATGYRTSASYFIHRLVLSAHVGPPPTEAHECNHKNGIKTDNRAENLEWMTSSENRAHAWRLGLIKQTEGRRAAGFRRAKKLRKLTDEQAAEVRQQVANGSTQTDVARRYGLSRRAVFNIVNLFTYPGVQPCTI